MAMQGDQYSIQIEGDGFDIEDVVEIEFVIGDMVKIYPDVVTYDSEEEVFLFPVTQAEMFAMRANSPYPAQARVKFVGGDVIGADMGSFVVDNSVSKAVL